MYINNFTKEADLITKTNFTSVYLLFFPSHCALWHYISFDLLKIKTRSLFGHILLLLRNKDIPANKTTRANFIPNGNKLQGQHKTTLPIVQQRSRTDSSPNLPTLKQRSGRDHRTSTGQEMKEGVDITD